MILNCIELYLNWIVRYGDRNRVWAAIFLHAKTLPNSQSHKAEKVRGVWSTQIRFFTSRVTDICWDIWTSRQFSNCDGKSLDHREYPQNNILHQFWKYILKTKVLKFRDIFIFVYIGFVAKGQTKIVFEYKILVLISGYTVKSIAQ